jgi:hypothetical protein
MSLDGFDLCQQNYHAAIAPANEFLRDYAVSFAFFAKWIFMIIVEA